MSIPKDPVLAKLLFACIARLEQYLQVTARPHVEALTLDESWILERNTVAIILTPGLIYTTRNGFARERQMPTDAVKIAVYLWPPKTCVAHAVVTEMSEIDDQLQRLADTAKNYLEHIEHIR